MKIIIMHQTVVKHDAIGNDIAMMVKILSQRYSCVVFAENCLNADLPYIDVFELMRCLSDTDILYIYHHSIYWEKGEEYLHNCKGKIIIRYHNITPAYFYKTQHIDLFNQCNEGRKQTIRLVNAFRSAYWLVDSQYNAEDISQVGSERLGVCAPFQRIDEWAQGGPDESILKALLYNRTLNLLFVGRVAPNKGHLFLLDALALYIKYFGCEIKLRIVGKFDDGTAPYNQAIRDRIETCGLSDNVECIGEINDRTLMSYYIGSDIFVCGSEHEGFCVPIVEAQYFGLPIVALNHGAVAETIGDKQVVLESDMATFVSAIHILADNERYRRYLRKEGFKNYQRRFSLPVLEKIFLTIIDRVGGADGLS